MKPHFLLSSVTAGVLGLSTLGLFYNGAEALDLSDFTGQDQRVITQEAPKAGGAVLVRESAGYNGQSRMMASPANYNNIAPGAGGLTARRALNASGAPGVGIDGRPDITTAPGNSFDQSKARFSQPGTASGPVDGKPLTTTTLANGARVNDMSEIAPAAGGSVTPAGLQAGDSIQAQTGRGSPNLYNN